MQSLAALIIRTYIYIDIYLILSLITKDYNKNAFQ